MKAVLTALVAVHLLVTVWHGRAHAVLAVTLSPLQNAFVLVVIVLAPILAAILVWTRYLRSGAWIFFLSMLGSLLFGAWHHYVLISADNVHHLPGGGAGAQSSFIQSAAVLALLELVSTLYGVFCLVRLRATAPPGRPDELKA
jgi:hypothetical protein